MNSRQFKGFIYQVIKLNKKDKTKVFTAFQIKFPHKKTDFMDLNKKKTGFWIINY